MPLVAGPPAQEQSCTCGVTLRCVRKPPATGRGHTCRTVPTRADAPADTVAVGLGRVLLGRQRPVRPAVGECSAFDGSPSLRAAVRRRGSREVVQVASCPVEGASAAAQVLPWVFVLVQAFREGAQGPAPRAQLRVVEFRPRQRGGDRGVRAGAHGVGGDRGLGVGVALGVQVEAARALALACLRRQPVAVPCREQVGDAPGEVPGRVGRCAGRAVPGGAGRVIPSSSARGAAQLGEQVAQPARAPPDALAAIAFAVRRVEVEDQSVGAVQAVRGAQPGVRGDTRLVGKIVSSQTAMVRRPPTLGTRTVRIQSGSSRERPCGRTLVTVRVALHHQRAAPEVAQHQGRDAAVVVDHLGLGDAVVREQLLVWVRQRPSAAADPYLPPGSSPWCS